MAWFDAIPERLEFELAALKDAGFECKVDEVKKAEGQLCLTIPYAIDGVVHPLTVIFPPDYPYFQFQVFAPTLNLPRHQDPYSKLLCLVANADSEWAASADSVARYLTEQLPQSLKLNSGQSNAKEAQEGAPVTGYINFYHGSLVLTGEWNLPKDQRRGTLVFGLEKNSTPNILLRGAVLEVRNTDGQLLGTAESAIQRCFPSSLKGRWVRLQARPKSDRPDLILNEAFAEWPTLRKPDFDGGPDIIGIVFQDEAQYNKSEDIWLFVVRVKERYFKPRVQGQKKSGDNVHCYLARPERGGKSDLQARVPRLKTLSEKKVAVFGLGALGSAMAMQLARAGVGKISLVDHDIVQAGNIPRWAYGLRSVGYAKAIVLAQQIGVNYPFVEALPYAVKVGAVMPPEIPYETLISQALENVDLIVDCTVEFTVQHFLSDFAWRRELPYIWASGTPGGWGGIIGRAVKGITEGCWKCFRFQLDEGAIESPAFEDGPGIQPVGCFSPTFTGAGFDMDSVTLQAVRLTISTLCLDAPDGYPDFDWDVGVVNLWVDGKPIAPNWNTSRLARHPACDAHG